MAPKNASVRQSASRSLSTQRERPSSSTVTQPEAACAKEGGRRSPLAAHAVASEWMPQFTADSVSRPRAAAWRVATVVWRRCCKVGRYMPDPQRHPDLHGNVPDRSELVLLVVDVLNPLEFPGSESFVPKALAVGRAILALKERASLVGVPTVYVNDNLGRWRSDLSSLREQTTREEAPGHELASLLAPTPSDYVVMKPKHSGFYSTPLDTLLMYLGARRLIITGLTVERCVLFTANDAFLRDYELFVPSDCTAAIDETDSEAALRILGRVLDADTRPAAALDLDTMLHR
jgi:nicotinamidase-related amidase